MPRDNLAARRADDQQRGSLFSRAAKPRPPGAESIQPPQRQARQRTFAPSYDRCRSEMPTVA